MVTAGFTAPRRRGFTLIELLVVLAIVATLLLIAAVTPGVPVPISHENASPHRRVGLLIGGLLSAVRVARSDPHLMARGN